jgi:hypothetical protein
VLGLVEELESECSSREVHGQHQAQEGAHRQQERPHPRLVQVPVNLLGLLLPHLLLLRPTKVQHCTMMMVVGL